MLDKNPDFVGYYFLMFQNPSKRLTIIKINIKKMLNKTPSLPEALHWNISSAVPPTPRRLRPLGVAFWKVCLGHESGDGYSKFGNPKWMDIS